MSERRGPPVALFKAANHLVGPLLRSPLHGLLSRRLLVIRYEGAKTGRRYAVPVAYYRYAQDEVWVFGARTGWMSHFRRPRTARLVLRGRETRAEGTAVEDREQVADLLQELVRRLGPRAILDPYLALPRDRPPNREEALSAAGRARIARFRLTPPTP
ncbi:hypothetical protein [Streptomyces cacaoi]|uniref:hypothetical protein n=1 Tax=Streptomyces cacaoi TaxID=1898 RepID=UPI0033335EB2